jgi:hypothetical protein
MTTTTVNAGPAQQSAADALVEAYSADTPNTQPALTIVKNEAPAPYHAREIKTAAQLLGLKMEAMLREFEIETGATIWNVRRDYNGKVTVDAQFEGSVIYTSH